MYRLIGIVGLLSLAIDNAISSHWLPAAGWALVFVAAVLESVEWLRS